MGKLLTRVGGEGVVVKLSSGELWSGSEIVVSCNRSKVQSKIDWFNKRD